MTFGAILKKHNSCYFLGHSWKIWTTFYFNIWSHWHWSTKKCKKLEKFVAQEPRLNRMLRHRANATNSMIGGDS